MNSIHFSHAPLNHHDQLPCTSPPPALSIPLSPDTRAQKVSSNSTIPTESSDLLHENGGQEVGIEREAWCKLAESEARLHLIMELMKIKVGFPDVEEFCLELESKYRSTATGSLREKGESSPEWQIVKTCMVLKLIDERKNNSKLMTIRYNLRKMIDEKFGRNSRRSRNKVKNLRIEATRRKKKVMLKYEEKLIHLKKKFRANQEEKIDKVPEVMKGLPLEELSIFDKNKYEAI